ncbi:uncharacterized protein LOC141640672 isoform X2 [Silene latifolia]|uniref:uncharacterized protein LOC141640672 isoform X2 n=1 Tax=Silene latifolia TaxID=37657 RepID=UPI003D780970
MDPFPSINKAFSLATQEECHKTIVRDRDDKTEAMSFSVQASSSSTSPPSVVPTSSLTCTYCTKPGHDYERCYQQIGYPTRGRGRGRSGRGRGSFSSGRGQQQQHAQPATQPATANTVHATRPEAPIVAASSASSSDVPALSSDQVQQLLTLLDNNFPSSKLSGPQFEDADWTG